MSDNKLKFDNVELDVETVRAKLAEHDGNQAFMKRVRDCDNLIVKVWDYRPQACACRLSIVNKPINGLPVRRGDPFYLTRICDIIAVIQELEILKGELEAGGS